MLPPSVSSRRRAASVVLCTAGLLALAGTGWAAEDIGGLIPSSTTTTTGGSTTTTSAGPAPTAPAAPSTTTTAPPASSTTTTAPAAPPIVPGSSTTTTAPPAATEPLPPGGGDGTAPTGGAGEFPPELQALTNSVRRSGASNTSRLIEALAPLQQFGLTETEAALVGFGRFPIAGHASYSHDWWFPRFGPGWRLHEGTDVFAPHGTPVRAPVDGHVRITNGGLGGLAVYVIQADGTYWYMAHLAGTAAELSDGQTVATGQVVGYVGDSGNARGGLPHLHFEIHPRGGPPIDPKPVLDQFISDAIALAPGVVQLYADRAAQAQAVVAAAAPPVPAVPIVAPRTALLWASSANPAGGALHLAEAEAARVAATVDWDARLAAAQARSALRQQFETWSRALLAPLTHPTLSAAIAI
jgi:murein DD-endopeptidase MepM/ murein hydrolase activator NlpD